MPRTVELVPISEGNRISIKENEKVIIGRGSSLGCDDKKISRQHAELILKNDQTLWIKPTHVNPVFYRPLHGKTSHLTKDVEQHISKDVSNHTDAPASTRADTSSQRKSPDVEPKPSLVNKTDSSSVKRSSQSESTDTDNPPRKLPAWMSASSRTDQSSPSKRSSTKRQLSSSEDAQTDANGSSDTSNKNVSAAADTASDSKPSSLKAVNSDSAETFDSVPSKKIKSADKPRTRCSYGATCYRKNPAHRTEQSHPGDSDYEDEKDAKEEEKKKDESSDDDKPPCPYGKTCYRQNPQHKRDYKH